MVFCKVIMAHSFCEFEHIVPKSLSYAYSYRHGLPHYLTMIIKPVERSTSTSIHSESEPL